jgi:arylsulfatase
MVNGVLQDPIDGVSFADALGDPTAPGRLVTQYFGIVGSRAIYHDGWMASAAGPRLPWVPGLPPGIMDWTPDEDQWRLYHLDQDWSQASDLAAQMPEKLAQMKETFAMAGPSRSTTTTARRCPSAERSSESMCDTPPEQTPPPRDGGRKLADGPARSRPARG